VTVKFAVGTISSSSSAGEHQQRVPAIRTAFHRLCDAMRDNMDRISALLELENEMGKWARGGNTREHRGRNDKGSDIFETTN